MAARDLVPSALARPAMRADGATPRRAALWLRRDWLIFLGLVALTALSRWPFRTRMIYAWDGGLFAQALRDYNVVPHHPQPPGYIFYVAVGKVIQAVTGWGPNATLVAISIGAASLTVGLLYLFGALLFDRLTGLLAAALGLTSVSFWLFSEIAYPYTVLALGSTVGALLCWLLATRRIPWPPLAALAFGLITGFRQDLLLFLGPLFVACYLWGSGLPARRGWRDLLLGALAGALGVAVWWVATDLASEGWGSLWRALTIQSANIERGTSAFATGETGLRGNGTLLVWFSKDALHLAVFPALAYLLLWPLAPRRAGWRPPFLLLWAAPAALFYLLVHIGEAGYVFSFLPAILIMAGAGLTGAARAIAENLPRGWREGRGPLLRGGIAILLAAIILPYHTWLFVGSGRLVSAERLGCKDEAIARAVAILASDYPPATTELVTSTYLQHIAVYLPQFRRVHFLDPDHSESWTPPPGTERVVVFDLELVQRFAHFERWSITPLACGGRYGLASVPAAGAHFTFDAKHFTLEVTR